MCHGAVHPPRRVDAIGTCESGSRGEMYRMGMGCIGATVRGEVGGANRNRNPMHGATGTMVHDTVQCGEG